MQAKITQYADVAQKTEGNDSSQETEIGLVPQGWEAVKLGDILIPVGEKIKRDQYNWDLDIVEKIPFNTGRIILRSKRGTKTDLYVSNFGTLVVSKINLHQGAVAINGIGKIACTTHYEVYNLKKSVDIVYFWYFLRSPEFKTLLYEDIKFRGFKKEANFNYLKDFKICLPSLPKQQRIAKVLGTIQRANEQQDKIIEAAKNLKKSLMQKLFTEGLGHTEFKETQIGTIPASWDVMRLGDLLALAQYGLSIRGSKEGKYPILRMNNLANGYVDPTDLQFVNVDEGKTFPKFKLEKGDVLFNRTNSIDLVGKTSIFTLDGNFVFASYLIRLKMNSEKLNSYFLNCYLNWDISQLRLKGLASRGVSQANISATRLKTLEISLPPPPEQQEIAHMLSTADKKIEAEKRRKATLNELFKTMLHRLMTGEIRLKDVEV